jgi:hypothetical protein
MLKTDTEKVGRIVDGQLSAKAGDVNIFDYEALNAEREKTILESFRGLVVEFEVVYGGRPTLALMSSNDQSVIVTAYNDESDAIYEVELAQLGEGVPVRRPRISAYSDEENRFVDGIKIKPGCDQHNGQVRFYAFE